MSTSYIDFFNFNISVTHIKLFLVSNLIEEQGINLELACIRM